MSPEAGQTIPPNTAPQNGAGPGGQLEPLGPLMFSRVQEPDSDGQVYDIKILIQPTGYLINIHFPFLADPATGISDDDDSHGLTACTLRIGAPIDKNRQRMVDGKIENLWLKDEGIANRLDNVRMLATLLGYVRNFCAGIEVPHISSIQKSDHPTWLRDFFVIAGFNRCECLKPEAGTQRYRACLKLGSPDQAAEQESVAVKLTGESKGKSDCTRINEKEKANSVPGVIHSPPALAGFTVVEISPVKQKPSLNLPKVTEAIMARQRPSVKLPKASETLSQGNDRLDNGSSKAAAPGSANIFSADRALAWLSQNKEILSPINTLPASRPPQAPSSNQVQPLDNRLASSGEALVGEKRKWEVDAAMLKSTEAFKRSTRQRCDSFGNEDELHIKQILQDKKLSLKPSTDSKQPSLPTARYLFTMADKVSESKVLSDGRSGDSSITDAPLAQVHKAAANKSPNQIKKEPTSSRLVSSPPPETRHHRSQDLPPKTLTCFYWKHQGGCNKRDEDCSYAHYDTGHDASAPNSWRYSASKYKYSSYAGQYDGGADSYSNPNRISIKGSYDGINGFIVAPTGPRATAKGLPYHGSRRKSYRSYRPGPQEE